jgi:hypothetical protein
MGEVSHSRFSGAYVDDPEPGGLGKVFALTKKDNLRPWPSVRVSSPAPVIGEVTIKSQYYLFQSLRQIVGLYVCHHVAFACKAILVISIKQDCRLSLNKIKGHKIDVYETR